MATREDDLRARMAAVMAQQDATARPARGYPNASTPMTLNAARNSPLGMLLEAALGMTPVGPAIDATNFAAATKSGDPAKTALAAAAFLPLLGDLLRRLGGSTRAGYNFAMPLADPMLSPKDNIKLARQVRALLQEGRNTEAQALMRELINVERAPAGFAVDKLPLTHHSILYQPKSASGLRGEGPK